MTKIAMTTSHRRALFVIGATIIAAAASPSIKAAPAATADDYILLDQIIDHETASNHVRIYGSRIAKSDPAIDQNIVILPSLGRGVEDYTEAYNSSLTTLLASAGFKVVLIQPRGIGQSKGDLRPEATSMRGLANDIKAVLDLLDIQTAHFVGHAFGNRLARTFATLYPDYVNKLALMASGGNFPLNDRQLECLLNSFNSSLSKADRLTYIECAFFAKGNNASVWLDGWYTDLAKAQIHAARSIDGNFYKTAGGKPFLIIQPSEDFIAPPDKAGKVLKEELGEQVSYIEIANSGHALSPEQPEEVARILVDYFSK